MEKPEPPPPSPLEAALHAQVNTIASRPIEPRMLLELEQTCRLSRELLAIGKAPDAFRKQHLIPHESGIGSGPMGSTVSMSMGGLAAPSNPTETFGVQAIKELINLLPGLMPKPAAPVEPQVSFTDLTTAILAAKQAGDTALYEQLTKILDAEHKRYEGDAPPASAIVETQGQAA
jgi:hypothetical protein